MVQLARVEALRMRKRGFLFGMVTVLTATAPALAQSPLMGNVEMRVQTEQEAGPIRINRTTLRPAVQASDYKMNLKPQQAQMAPLLDTSAFKAAAAALSSAIEQNRQTETKQKEAPYIWYQSAQGGYYDASGTTKELVWADKLYKYGGKFEDGTRVPERPIRDFNAMGHAWRGNALNTSHFWSH